MSMTRKTALLFVALLIYQVLLTCSDAIAQRRALPDHDPLVTRVITAQHFGGGTGVDDSTRAVQKAVDWAVRHKATVHLRGALVIRDTIRVCRKGAAQQVSIKMDPKLTFNATGDCLVWDGPPNKAMVDIGIMQRSVVSLNLTNPKRVKGVTGLLWHNPNDERTACNGNTMSLTACWCELGMRWGDFEHDHYHSNIDDNHFPYLAFSRCRHALLVDSNRQDNNVIQRFHSGGTAIPQGELSREYIIRANYNGNGFRIDKGFIRTDRMKPGHAVIDIRQGAFSCGSMSMETGYDDEANCLPIRIGSSIGRGQCVIRDLYLDDRLRNSDGDCVVTNFRSGVTFIGCNFSGNVRTSRPVTILGSVFKQGFEPKVVGNTAALTEISNGSRASAAVSIKPIDGMVRSHGFVPRSVEHEGGTVWPEFSHYSVFIIDATKDIRIAKASKARIERDKGRRITFMFRGGDKNREAEFDKTFSLKSGQQTIKIEASQVSVVEFISDGKVWQQSSN